MPALDDHIEAVESAYEFTLAYAAQGKPDDAAGPGPYVRDVLTELSHALAAVVETLPEHIGAFRDVVLEDARKAAAAVNFVLAQPRIGSELVDNLNASIHLRAVLTDLFLVSEALSDGAD